jgi:hypothetical protein
MITEYSSDTPWGINGGMNHQTHKLSHLQKLAGCKKPQSWWVLWCVENVCRKHHYNPINWNSIYVFFNKQTTLVYFSSWNARLIIIFTQFRITMCHTILLKNLNSSPNHPIYRIWVAIVFTKIVLTVTNITPTNIYTPGSKNFSSALTKIEYSYLKHPL